jgi:hypothetical protein
MRTKISTHSPFNFIAARYSNLMLAVLFLCLVGFITPGSAQICIDGTPMFSYDFTGHPDTTVNTNALTRGGGCCGTSNCVNFDLILDAATLAFDVKVLGASAFGSFELRVDCGEEVYSVGDLICLSGGGHHNLTICKPGSNDYAFALTAVSAPTFPSSDTVRAGCSSSMTVHGLIDSTITWQSIYPGNPGDYNSYLSCISKCSTTTFNPAVGAPGYIDY